MLSILIWLPVLAGLAIACLPEAIMTPTRSRQVAMAIALVILGWTGYLLTQFDVQSAGLQFQESFDWIAPLGLSYRLGMDGLSLPLIAINSLLVYIALYCSDVNLIRPRLYYSLMMLLAAGVAGAFLAQNLLLFFLFYEVELIPLYLMIAIWGGSRRGYAATKFLIYTAISGALILAAFFGLALLSGSFSFDYEQLQNLELPMTTQLILLVTIVVGFGIKVPIVPLHTWLPDAHVQAPTPTSVLLAGVLLKLGTYGLLRFGLQLLPDAWRVIAPALAILAVVNVLYGSFVAIAQTDMKKMVAYSSVGHMGYVMLAAAAATPLSIAATIAQMISHGLISALLFLLVGVVYSKTGTRNVDVLQGLLNPERGLPLIGSLMIVSVMASAGIPGMIGFIAEFLVYRSSFPIFPVATLLCMLGTALTAVYFLNLINRSFFGRLPETFANLPAIYWKDRIPALIVVALVIAFGLQPGWIIRWSEPTSLALGTLGDRSTTTAFVEANPLTLPLSAPALVD